uniref:Light-independent protochlorophyllide reductase subunit B n=1 Tax=Cryptomonas sp. CCAC 1634B TaxID=2051848 RepID=A0A679CAW6_9CRYP|nr:protochlorophyllide reductase subunit B [Cryptomonas sp. CCAC 1634B]
MKLAYWTYVGPAHVGILRITNSFKNVHALVHAPLGDDFFTVTKSMLERSREFTSVTTNVIDRHSLATGPQSSIFSNIIRKDLEHCPDLIVLTPTCTSSVLQEDLHAVVCRVSLDTKADVMLADINHYRANEFEAADKTLEQILRLYLTKQKKVLPSSLTKTTKPSVNILGPCCIGFHTQHDILELKRLFAGIGVDVNLVVPEGATVHELALLPRAWCNVVPYREIGILAAEFLKATYDMPYISTSPIGVINLAKFVRDLGFILHGHKYYPPFEMYLCHQTKFSSQASWFSRSVDCHNLTGRTAVVFGDATHAAAITKILSHEMGVQVLWSGTYCTHDALWFNKEVTGLCNSVVVTDDYAVVRDMIVRTEPAVIFGTQMETHIGKKLGIPCGVISSPIHVQNFPLAYTPFLGYEGTNHIADLIYGSFTLGMETHLLELFGGHDPSPDCVKISSHEETIRWSTEALLELRTIPNFIRRKVQRNIEDFARKKRLTEITLNAMYDAREAS